jgi:hypothetical protein
MVAQLATNVNSICASCANDTSVCSEYGKRMHNVVRIHKGKQPNRPHYVEAWAEKRGYPRQSDLAEAIGADKSLVSRWFKGATPNHEYQIKLAELFHCDRESLFRHPDDDWLSRFLRGRPREEVDKIKQLLELAFPRTGT